MPPEILTDLDAGLDAVLRSRDGLAVNGPDLPISLASLFRVMGGQAEKHRMFAETQLYTQRPRRLVFGFVDQNHLNAFAYAADGARDGPVDFIGINVGVPLTLLVIFRAMLARRDVLPEVGNAALEEIVTPAFTKLSSDAVRDQLVAVEPRCPVRYAFGQYLASVAFDILFFHELTHLRNGHLDLLNACGSACALVELDAAADQDIGGDGLRRALEADADCGAILWALNLAHDKAARVVQSREHFASDEAYEGARAMWGTHALATRSTTFAAYVLFRIMAGYDARPRRQPTGRYPSPPARFRIINETIRAMMIRSPEAYEFNALTFDAEQLATMSAAESACAAICGRDPNLAQMLDDANAEFMLFTVEFVRTWAEIRPELERYKRGGNLAPAQV